MDEQMLTAFFADHPEQLPNVRYVLLPGEDEPAAMLNKAGMEALTRWATRKGYVVPARAQAFIDPIRAWKPPA